MKRTNAAAFLLFVTIAGGAVAGPLSPPAGPVAPTSKVLNEIEPRIPINATNTPGDNDSLFKITQPGSYYLTGNITAVANKHGIEIAASGVTIDLNGFDMVGIPAMGPFDAITATVSNSNSISISNGSVRNWGGDGIDLGTITTRNSFVSDVRASNNSASGIRISTGSSINRCTANQNGSDGLWASLNNTISASTAHQNAGNGIVSGFASVVSNCSSINNTVNGLVASNGSVVTNSTFSDNTIHGVVIASNCIVTNCHIGGNSNFGIFTDGFGSILNCIVSSNASGGIRCVTSGVIRGNTLSNNGLSSNGAGIFITGTNNHIDQNNCTSNSRGIDIDGTGNIVTRNTCSDNAINWEIATGNAVAPIIAPATNSSPITTNTYSGSLSTTDPNANFSY